MVKDINKAPIVIVGSGQAGFSVAREFRKYDSQTPLVMVTADDGCFYSKPMLSNILAADKSTTDLVLTSRAKLAAELNAEIRPYTRVERILLDEHALETSTGRLNYSKLVLAVGAHPISLPLQGDGADEVLSVNNLTDHTHFINRLKQICKTCGQDEIKNVAMIGAGQIGCEFANELRSAGFYVDVFDVSPQPLSRLLPPKAAAFLKTKLEAHGIRFFGATGIVQVAKEGEAYRLTDSHGTEHQAKLVFSAVGLVPAIELAQAAGLKTQCGIVVNKQLRTSNEDVFALGDCAEVGGLVLPFIMPIMHAARSLAKALVAIPKEADEVLYPAMPIVVKTKVCSTVVCPPPMGSEGRWLETADATGVRAVFEDSAGKIIGFALVGDAGKETPTLLSQMPAWL